MTADAAKVAIKVYKSEIVDCFIKLNIEDVAVNIYCYNIDSGYEQDEKELLTLCSVISMIPF